MLSATQVLVVANEPELLSHVYTSLTLEGHRVTAVKSGSDALQRVRDGLNPDLIFLDSGLSVRWSAPGTAAYSSNSPIRAVRSS